MTSPPSSVLSTISRQSSGFTRTYITPSGSICTSGPISQKPWQPLILMCRLFSASPWWVRPTYTCSPRWAHSSRRFSYTFMDPLAIQPVPAQISTFRDDLLRSSASAACSCMARKPSRVSLLIPPPPFREWPPTPPAPSPASSWRTPRRQPSSPAPDRRHPDRPPSPA